MKYLGLLTTTLFLMLSVACKGPAGEKAEVKDAAVVQAATGINLPVNISNSVVNWQGSKPTGTHTGTINLQSGEVTVKDGQVSGGKFVLDINSINVTDLEGDYKAGLESHLKGLEDEKQNHFFDVRTYPTAAFEITKIVSLEGDADANSTVYGNLTIKDTTKEIGFRANITANNDGVVVSTPQFTIDRTQWGVNYGSKTIFDNLGDKFVNDEIGLAIQLHAGKEVM